MIVLSDHSADRDDVPWKNDDQNALPCVVCIAVFYGAFFLRMRSIGLYFHSKIKLHGLRRHTKHVEHTRHDILVSIHPAHRDFLC